MYDELQSLENETGIILAASPTQKVGYEVLSELPKEKHDSPMLSLNKTKSREELASFLNSHEGVLSWKMDGLTVVLTYREGRLFKAVTRGNGEIGEVITPNAKTFKNVPLSIPFKGELVLRGEAIIRYSDFERINSSIPDVDAKYKNPRNLCSGSVRQLDSSITAKRSVYLYAFALISVEGDDAPSFRLRSEQFDYLESLGFTVVERKLVNSSNVADTVSYFADAIASNDFPSDGLVLVYNDIEYGRSLGRTAKFPRDGIAFKWADETAVTVLREIEWSPSRTGLINPVAIFDPVELEGTTVTRASLHNISIMEELKLGISDRVTVYKANMIIPQIADNLDRSGHFDIPCVCPVCFGATEVHNENGVKTLYCTNSDCAAKKIKLFALMASRDALNIDGLSEMTIEKLIDAGIIHDVLDFFRLSEKRERIAMIEGMGEKSAGNLIDAVEKARTTNLYRVVYSLGIPGIGLANAKLISKAVNDDEHGIPLLSFDALIEIENVGEVLAKAFVDYFADEHNRQMYDAIINELILVKEQAASDKLSGLNFVITGSVEQFANRNELKAFIEARGGKVTGSVTKNTDFLINNDITSSSSKNKTAKELGVEIISEDIFIERFGRE